MATQITDSSAEKQNYELLLSQFQNLNTLLNKFINGDPDETVTLASGAIKTLAGVVADLEQIKYVLKVKEFSSFLEAVSYIQSFGPNDLIFIPGDGTYKRAGSTLEAVNLSELDSVFAAVAAKNVEDTQVARDEAVLAVQTVEGFVDEFGDLTQAIAAATTQADRAEAAADHASEVVQSLIDDDSISDETVWSSVKTNQEIQSIVPEPIKIFRDNFGVAYLGDSISAEGGLQKTSWAYAMSDSSEQKLRMRGVFAVGGAKPTDLEGGLFIQVLALSPAPRYCVLACGTNAIYDQATVNDEYLSVLSMCEKLEDKNITPVLWVIPPNETAKVNAESWNARIRLLAASKSYPVVDAYTPLVDALTGLYSAGNAYDGVHPTDAGHGRIVSYNLPRLMDRMIGDSEPILTATNSDAGNLFAGGLFAVDSNGDGVADGLFGDSTSAGSLVAADIGNYQTITRLANADAPASTISSQPIDVSVGSYRFTFKYKCDLDTSTSGLSPTMQVYWVDQNYGGLGTSFLKVFKASHPEEGIVSVDLVAPANSAHMQILFPQFYGPTPTKDVSIGISQLTIQRI